MMLICIKQHLSSIWSSIHENVINTEAELTKSVAYKKACVLEEITISINLIVLNFSASKQLYDNLVVTTSWQTFLDMLDQQKVIFIIIFYKLYFHNRCSWNFRDPLIYLLSTVTPKNILIHFMPLVFFCTLWKYEMLSGAIERGQWHITLIIYLNVRSESKHRGIISRNFDQV